MSEDFLKTYNGSLKGVLRWEQLDTLWATLSNGKTSGWYLYAIGHDLPEEKAEPEEVERFMTKINRLLHDEHDEDYCGIVYVDDFDDPALIKVYDPGNLGVACGSSDQPPLPGWVMSRSRPADLMVAFPIPGNRKRWWASLWQ